MNDKMNDRMGRRDGWRVSLLISNIGVRLGLGDGYRRRRGGEKRDKSGIVWDVRVDVFRLGPDSIWQTAGHKRKKMVVPCYLGAQT
jgi:hypothetical protein